MKSALFSLVDDLEDHIPEFRKKLQLLEADEINSEVLCKTAKLHQDLR